MLVVVSPAKKLNMDPVDDITVSKPDFPKQTSELVDAARQLSSEDLQQLMGLSPVLAELNRERFAAFGTQVTKPAALAFAGDTYQGLESASLDSDEMAWAQNHLRILSGLYGLLRPLDAIEPYRLEMGSRLETARGKTLYAFWGEQIAKALNVQAEATGTEVLVNCSSQEYFKAVDVSALVPEVITPVFMESKDGRDKVVSFFAKKARGAMARHIIQNRLTDPEGLKDFSMGGYQFQPEQSDDRQFVFLRDYPVAA